jgi:hypothetical protein
MSPSPESIHLASSGYPERVLSRVLCTIWVLVRLPIAALLAICEPVVRVVLAGSALLLVFTTGFLALVRPAHAVPLLGMLGVAVGLVLLLALYYGILRALSA